MFPCGHWEKVTTAVKQVFNRTEPAGKAITNFFDSTKDLLHVVCFPTDTSLNGKYIFFYILGAVALGIVRGVPLYNVFYHDFQLFDRSALK